MNDPVAVVVVRDGVPGAGADEVIAEAGGTVLLIGSGTAVAAERFTAADRVWRAEAGGYAPARWAARLAGVLADCPRVLLSASADGRDLAPRLADALGWPLLPGAVLVTEHGAEVVRWDGRVSVDLAADGPFVATLLPGVRGVAPRSEPPDVRELTLPETGPLLDPVTIDVLEPDPATADLAEAPRILSAGAGLGDGELSGADAVSLLGRVAAKLGASLGATRVVTDAGWTAYQRQVGTTGVVVRPDLYVAFGVSGAAQHVGGLAGVRHLVSVNTDASCPLTALAGLGIVADAQGLLRELAARLDVGEQPDA